MFQTRLFLFLLLLVVISLPQNAFAQLDDITITEETELDFGRLLADKRSSIVTVQTNGSVNTTQTTIYVGGASVAQFRITGEPDTNFILSFSEGDFLNGPGQAIEIGDWQHNGGSNLFFNGAGQRNINVGGRMYLNANQLAGIYTGTYTITVNYQ